MKKNVANIKILDCTLRDGGYINGWNFGKECITQTFNALNKTGVDYIECGFLQDNEFSNNKTLFGSFEHFGKTFKKNGAKLALMLKYGHFEQNKIPKKTKGNPCDVIRVNYCKKESTQAIKLIEEIKDLGYEIFINPANIDLYENYEFKKLIKTVNAINPKAFSIVDTKGTLGQNDIQGLYKLIEDELNESISLCFHSHNNLALSFLNTKKLISLCQKRELILDCSIFGMGRGAGNLHGELLMSYLNNVYGKNYNISPLFEIIEKYINPIYKKTPWKSSLPYFLSALNRCHQDYAKYLADKENLSFEFINTLLCAIPKNKKSSYDENLIKEMYQSAHKENSLARSASIS